MKTLFLDFDGVLHNESAADNLWEAGSILADSDCFAFIDHLATLLDGHSVDVVVHSGWRLGGQFTHDELRAFLRKLGSRFQGITLGEQRYDSILRYIADHGVTDYRILDDADFLFPPDLPELIVCHPTTGMSDPAVQERLCEWLAS